MFTSVSIYFSYFSYYDYYSYYSFHHCCYCWSDCFRWVQVWILIVATSGISETAVSVVDISV